MPTVITGSVNIASLDSKITSDLCVGIFYIDLSPSIAIGAGFGSSGGVLGASVKVTNPFGVVIKNFPTSGYDIYPPMTTIVQVSVPTMANNFQYGTYIVQVDLTDADGTIYTITKSITICAPNPKNKNVKFGSLSAILDGNCVTGKVTVIADTVPTYQGEISESQVNDFTLEYPTSSGIDELETTFGSFSATLFEGVYKFTGTICALYNMGDNVYVKVNYKVKKEKNIRCLLDKACVAARLASIQGQIDADCTDAEKIATQNIIIEALLLLTVIDGLTNSGQDAGDFIAKLEEVLGCVCTCNCADGTPIINSNPTGDFLIQGCNTSSEVVDLTTVYNIDNYIYRVVVEPNGGAITISVATLDNCVQEQRLTFNIATVYSQIKNQITNSTQYNFWASVINNTLDDLDISCLNVEQENWDNFSFRQRIGVIVAQLCVGAVCEGIISANATDNEANDVVVTWTNGAGVYEVSVYLDGIFQGSVLADAAEPETFTILGAADGNAHEYRLVCKCDNGSVGTQLAGTFNYFGCPTIAVLTVSSNSVSDAECPYDLTALVSTPPMGITAEWHNLNNTLPTSLVADPTTVADGTYFVFGKNSDGCYGLPAQVIIVCSEATNCSAPQTTIVEAITGGFRVRFQSAAFPPPSNSYTVKRRLTAAADVPGNYTTIGTPTWNATANRWEILDATPSDNVSYTYRAISNCASSAPYQDYVFANLSCPTLTLTPNADTIDYSFVPAGGGIDKYEVKLYNFAGVVLQHTDTILPAFSNPETGTFFYLNEGTTYKARIRVYIGTFYKDCPLVTTTTTGSEGTINIDDCGNGNQISAIRFNSTLVEVSGGYPIEEGDSVTAVIGNAALNGTLEIDITGHTGGTVTRIETTSSTDEFDCTSIDSNDTFTFTLFDVIDGDTFDIHIKCGGSCP